MIGLNSDEIGYETHGQTVGGYFWAWMSLAVVGGVQPEKSGDHLSSPSLLRHRPRHCPLLLLLRSQGDQKHYLHKHLLLLKWIPEYERAVVLGTTLSLATIRWRFKKSFFWNFESFLLLSASYTAGVLASYSSCPSWKRSKGCVPIIFLSILFSIILLCAHHLVEESYWYLLFTFQPHAWPLSRWTFEHVCLRYHPSRFSPRTRLAWPLMYNT